MDHKGQGWGKKGDCFLRALVHLYLTLKLVVPTAVLPTCKPLLELTRKTLSNLIGDQNLSALFLKKQLYSLEDGLC